MRLGISSFISDILSTSSNICFCWTEGKVESNLHHPAAAAATASLAFDVLWSQASGLLCLWVLLITQVDCWAVMDLISHQSLVWSCYWLCCWVQDWCAECPEVLKGVHTSWWCLSHRSRGQTGWLLLVIQVSFCHLLNLPVGAFMQLQVTAMQHPPQRCIATFPIMFLLTWNKLRPKLVNMCTCPQKKRLIWISPKAHRCGRTSGAVMLGCAPWCFQDLFNAASRHDSTLF